MRCSNCGKWELGGSDSFCAWCGETVEPLALSLEPSRFVAGHAPGEAVLAIRNTGTAGPVRIVKVWADRGWIRVDDGAARGRELHPDDGPLSLEVEVDPSGLADDFHKGTVFVETEAKGTREEKVEVSPAPRWDIPDPQPLFLEPQEKEVSVPLTLVVERGALTVKGIEAQTDGWARVQFDGAAGGVKLSSRGQDRYTFRLLIEADKMPRAAARQLLDRYEVDLRLEFAELVMGGSKTVRFACVLPPQLVIVEQDGGGVQVEAFRGEREEVTLHLQNGFRDEVGRAALTVKGVNSNRGWLQPKKSELPLVIESGKAAALTFVVDAADPALAGVEEDTAALALEVEPAEKEKGRVGLSVIVRATERPVYGGWLCIDFGTTNTCVGASELDKDSNPRLLPVDIRDGGNVSDRKVISSAILYEDLTEDGERVYKIGSAAYNLLYRPAAEGSVFDQIKRKLGRGLTLPVRFLKKKNTERDATQRLAPREIATDIFKRLLANSEKTLRGKVVRCAVSHPSRVSRLQLKDLRDAITAAFESYEITSENLKFFHEPVAAAVDYLTTQAEPPPGEGDYHILVYDFGGGTTDIALIRVSERRHPRRGRIVRPEVLTVDGDPALGGEDVTDMLMRLYHGKIERQPPPPGGPGAPAWQSLRLPIDAAEETDLLMQSVARANRAVLRPWAEQQKILMAGVFAAGGDMPTPAEAQASLPEGKLNTLTYIVDGKPVDNVFTSVDYVAKDDFNAKLAEMLGPSVQKVVELLGKVNLRSEDVAQVVLSGQSSAFPVVGEVIRARLGLGEERVRRLGNPKECVVRGLCVLQSDELLAGLAVIVETQGCLSAATSRLGVRVRDRGKWVFKQLIGAGTPLGKEGFSREVTGVSYKRNTTISLYEHMGPETDTSFDEKDRRINVVKNFRLPDKLEEMGEAGKRITDEMLLDSALWFSINDNHEVELEIKFRPEDNVPPIKFEATYAGY